MKGFGRIIRLLRESKGLTQSDLGKNICSGKYVYLVEKGKRFPSVEIITKMGECLNTDLFEYLPYMECNMPIEVRQLIEDMNAMRNQMNLEKLMALVNFAKTVEDFNRQPWHNEVRYNEIYYLVNKNPKSLELKGLIEGIILENRGVLTLVNIELENLNEELGKYYNLLALYYFRNGDSDSAYLCVEAAFKYFDLMKEQVKNQMFFVSVALNYIQTLISLNRYLEGIAVAETLIHFQNKKNLHDRAFASYYFLSQALYKLERLEEAGHWYKKFVLLGLSVTKPQHFINFIESDFGKAMSQSGLLQKSLENEIDCFLERQDL